MAGKSRKINLTRGQFCIVDVEDFEWLSQYKWRATIQGPGGWRFLGNFDTIEEASKTYIDATKQIHGEFARVDS